MSALSYLRQFFAEILVNLYEVCITLFKIMIPAIILIKIADSLGGVELLGQAIGPLMQSLGLSEEMGLVWSATLATNLYSGFVILADMGLEGGMTVAQATVLGMLLLTAHALPVEVAIAKKAGVNVWVILLVRLGGAMLFASILYHLFTYSDWLQTPANNLVHVAPNQNNDLWSWGIAQLQSFALIIVVIAALLILLKVLRILGIERLMAIALTPLLKMLGIGKEATNFAIIGITLGLSFGGGLLINEAKKGHVKARDIFTTIVLLSLLHSLIEDTLLILLIGADFHSIFWGRLLMTLVLVTAVSRLMMMLDEETCQRWFYRSVSVNNGGDALQP